MLSLPHELFSSFFNNNPSRSVLYICHWHLPAANISCNQNMSNAMLKLKLSTDRMGWKTMTANALEEEEGCRIFRCFCCLPSVGRPLALYWFLWALMLNKCGQVRAHVLSSGVVYELDESRWEEFVVRERWAARPPVCASRILLWNGLNVEISTLHSP